MSVTCHGKNYLQDNKRKTCAEISASTEVLNIWDFCAQHNFYLLSLSALRQGCRLCPLNDDETVEQFFKKAQLTRQSFMESEITRQSMWNAAHTQQYLTIKMQKNPHHEIKVTIANMCVFHQRVDCLPFDLTDYVCDCKVHTITLPKNLLQFFLYSKMTILLLYHNDSCIWNVFDIFLGCILKIHCYPLEFNCFYPFIVHQA